MIWLSSFQPSPPTTFWRRELAAGVLAVMAADASPNGDIASVVLSCYPAGTLAHKRAPDALANALVT